MENLDTNKPASGEHGAADAAVLHEQLALHRLRRLIEAEARKKEGARRALKRHLRLVWRALVWLFTPVVPVRRDAPHLPPIPRDEWDQGKRYVQRLF